jgi:hypothetical protein
MEEIDQFLKKDLEIIFKHFSLQYDELLEGFI